MPQSLSAVYIHLVFSTKDRRPWLRDRSLRQPLHAYVGSVSKQLDCPALIVGGIEDHVHLLARFARTITQARHYFPTSAESIRSLPSLSHSTCRIPIPSCT